MTQPPRTVTPVDATWSRRQIRHRWHMLWLRHLEQQVTLNPNHPALVEKPTSFAALEPRDTTDLYEYRLCTQMYLEDDQIAAQWDAAVDEIELTTRHDLAAELAHLNTVAGRDTAHHGLTSHDIVDVATQQAVIESMGVILEQAATLARTLANAALKHQDVIIVERTHGQPAQASLYGLRLATIAAPLIDWHIRAYWYMTRYRTRPAHGAVGTGADLHRLLTTGYGRKPATPDWNPNDQYDLRVAKRFLLDATRQTYHRVYDLHIAGLLLELAAIADTWSADRRLEAMLGLGNEQRDPGQIGSSAMAHKTNPVLAERVHGLVGAIAGYHEMAARAASTEWLGGDVSGSSTRRTWLPGIMQTASALLLNWQEAHERWQIDHGAIWRELGAYHLEISTGARLQAQIDRGQPRAEAYETIRTRTDAGLGARADLTVEGLNLQHALRIIASVAEATRNLP